LFFGPLYMLATGRRFIAYLRPKATARIAGWACAFNREFPDLISEIHLGDLQWRETLVFSARIEF
jgi:hypothetical protein